MIRLNLAVTGGFLSRNDPPTPGADAPMSGIDLRTAFLLAGMLFVVVPICALAIMGGQRDRAASLWFGGGITIGCGALLLSQRAHAPAWLAQDVGWWVMLLGLYAKLLASRIELGRPIPARVSAAMVGGTLLAFLAAMSTGQVRAALLVVLLAGLAQLAWLCTDQIRLGRQESLRACRWICAGYLGAGFGLALRLVSVLAGWTPAAPFGAPDAVMFDLVALMVLSIFTAVIGDVGYLAMRLERATQRAMELAVKQARQEQSNLLLAQLTLLERQRSLGEMATTLAHEVRQPLTALLANVQLACRIAGRTGAPPALGEALDRAVRNTHHATEVLERIRGYSRMAPSSFRILDLEQVARDVIELVADEARGLGIELRLLTSSGSAWVLADRLQMAQVVLNLLRNAMEAMDDAPRRGIDVSLVVAAGAVELEVHDSGPGLSDDALRRAGDAFFTTKPDGLGVGLSISRAIAVQHGGTLRIRNASFGGAVAVLALPRTEHREATAAPEPASAEPVAVD